MQGPWAHSVVALALSAGSSAGFGLLEEDAAVHICQPYFTWRGCSCSYSLSGGHGVCAITRLCVCLWKSGGVKYTLSQVLMTDLNT